jgi:glycosyltransferase involved in cell wall biosynthesis
VQHGGVGAVTRTLGRALVQRGHDVTVLGVYPGARHALESDAGVRVERLAHAPVRGTGCVVNGRRLARALERLSRERPIDLIEAPESGLAILPRNLPAQTVVRMHGGHHFFAITLGRRPRPWRAWLETKSFKRADHLCAVSRFVAVTTRDLLQLGTRPIEILPNPVNLALFHPRPRAIEEQGLILFVGTVCEKKGIRELIGAMPLIINAVPEARLWVAGRDWRDPRTGASFTEHLRSSIPSQFSGRIAFLGPIEHERLPEVIARASVCVYPSHMEAFGVAWLEAMAMRKTVIAGDTGPAPELIEHGETGILCDPRTPQAIADATIALLTNPMRRCRLGDQAYEHAARYSVHSLAERNEAFYLRCLASARAA